MDNRDVDADRLVRISENGAIVSNRRGTLDCKYSGLCAVSSRWAVLFFLMLLSGIARSDPGTIAPIPRVVDAYGDSLPDGAVARLGSVWLQHFGLTDFAIIDGGQTLVTVGLDGTARWWNSKTRKLVAIVPLYFTQITGAALSFDGKIVAIKTDKLISIRDTSPGHELHSFAIHGRTLYGDFARR